MSPRTLASRLVPAALLVTLVTPGVLPASEPPETRITPDPLAFVSPSRSFKTVHTSLDLDLDLEEQTIAGSVTLTLTALRSGLTEIALNAVELQIESVSVGDAPADFDYPVSSNQTTSWFEAKETSNARDQLVIHAPQPFARGEQFTVTVNYHGAPKMGLYWIQPEEGLPHKRYEVWSQGEGEDNRYWIPSYDYPNDTATFEGTFRIDKPYYVLSNGVLAETRDLGAETEYRWRLDQPVVNYLIMIAAAEYGIHEDEINGIPLMYLVPPEIDKETVARGYGKTPAMLEFFADVTGIDYPFDKYAQVSVQNFIYGGMENASATTMNMSTMFSERLELTDDKHGLVAHEAAHQWWGDIVTCREWSHFWLNEGFATYYQMMFVEHDEGDDAFRWDMFTDNLRTIERDDSDPRPVVTDFFNRRDARNSNNVYNKGAVFLHMLRYMLGDELFHATVKHYGTKHAHGVVETSDLSRAVKDVTGENLDWFFEQWLYLVGHPKFKVTKSWDARTGMLNLNVKQTQEVTRLWPVYRVVTDIEVTTDEGVETFRVLIEKPEHDFTFSLPSEPRMVIFDKGDWILKTLDFSKTAGELAYQLEHGDYMARIYAADALGKKGSSPETVPALEQAMLAEGHFGLRRRAALALGEVQTEAARNALIEGTRNPNARVRLASAEALGKFRHDETAADVLTGLLAEDVAYGVREKAVASLVKMESKKAARACRDAIAQDSDRSLIRNAGIKGLVTLEDTEALGLIQGYASAGNDREHRHTAMTAYAKLAKLLENERDRKAAADFLADQLDDWYLRTRSTAISALGTLGEKSAIADLRRVESQDPLEDLRAKAGKTANKLEEQPTRESEIQATKQRVKELEQKLEKMQELLDELRKKTPEPAKKGDPAGVD